MKTAETKTAASPHLHQTGMPFFQKNGEGAFFSDKQSDVQTKPFFSKQTAASFIQPKLTVGRPGDRYEKEADAMADQVVQRLNNPEILQTKPIHPASTITPLVQSKCACEEEEQIQKKEEEEDRLEHGIQQKPIFESNEPPPEEKEIRRKCAECLAAEAPAKEEEAEDQLQKKELNSSEAGSTSSLENRLNASRGSGSPLTKDTRNQMESSFGADFSSIRIHTGSNAVQMNKDLHAQAFTHGSDIYFNSGKYNPESIDGRKLLAHELTHTVQQGGKLLPKIQRLGDDELVEAPPIPDNTPVEQSVDECPDLIPDYPLQPEVTPTGDSQNDESFYETLLGLAGVGLGGGFIAKIAGNIAFWTWRQLPISIKIRAINIALNNAESVFLVGKAAGRAMWGSAYGWVSAGMLGFIRKVKTLSNEEKVRIFEKAGKIILGQSLDFTLGMLKGIVIGIVMDGLVGIIQLVIDLFCFVPKILDFFRSLKNFFEQLPEDIIALYENLAKVKSSISDVLDNAMNEFMEMVKNPRKVMGLLNAIYDAGASAAEKVGEAMASGMIRAYRLPAFSLGEIAGRIGGQIVFEVLLTYFTAGGGAFISGAKIALRFIGKFFMKLGRYIFTIVRYLGKVLRKIGSVLKGLGKFLSRGIREVTTLLHGAIDKILNLFRKFDKYCRPSSIICHIPHGLANVMRRTRNGFYLIEGNLRTGWLHIQARHIIGGARVTPGTSMFPRELSGGRIRNLLIEAVENGDVIRNQVGGRSLIRYRPNQFGIKEMEVWVNNTTRVIETAYPTKGTAVWIAR